ncbi:type III-B CRISPR module-associated protein Cmr5 [Methylohalobius crimeensis]|uniref:type III-B CRISPR module-associated protein Cmr5 n=1 Tax=Methylohalobius crimeensis TaxID=244365 RepID=UPI0003B4BDC5|nr:type III-B CRISPR module-associated protein Cmr5 [Methylohalobius crimeensis]
MSKLTLEQQRAKDAWQCAQEGIIKHDKDYVNDAKGLPALIMNSGLMQVMAFLHQKGGRHETLGSQLRAWLHGRYGVPKDFEEFMQTLMEQDAPTFQAITAESFAWLRWLRQLASARMGEET